MTHGTYYPYALAQQDIGDGTEEMGRRLAEKVPDYIDALQAYAASVADNPLLAAMPIAGVVALGGTALLAPVGLHHAKHSVTGDATDTKIGDRLQKGIDEWFSMPIWLKWKDRCMHTMLLGPTGSGKTTALLPQLIQDLLSGRSAVIVQVQGDFAEDGLAYAKALGCSTRHFTLSDTGEEGVRKFNPVRGLDTEEVAERIASAMKAAVGEHSHFEDVAEDVTRNFTILARQYAEQCGYSESDANLELIQYLIVNRDFLEEDVLQVTRPEDDNGKPTGKIKVNAPWLDSYVAMWLEQSYLRWTSQQMQNNTIGVTMVLRRVLNKEFVREAMSPAPADPILDLAAEVSDTADRRKTRESGEDPHLGKLIVVDAFGAGPEASGAIAHWAIKTIADGTRTRTKESDPLCIYLDELPTLIGDGNSGALKDFNSWLATIRKYQVAVIVAFQGWSQLPKLMADNLDTNCRNKLIAPGSEADIQKLKRMLGAEQEESSESLTPGSLGPDQVRSRSRRKVEKSALTYEQILRLSQDEWIWIGTKNGKTSAPLKLRTPPPKPLKSYAKYGRDRAPDEEDYDASGTGEKLALTAAPHGGRGDPEADDSRERRVRW